MSQPRAFDIFPAIDVLGGHCVRLLQGNYDARTEYGAHPREVAERWLNAGSRWLHVVDLDAAKSGVGTNTDVITDVVRAASEVGAKVQVGGGIRTFEAIAHWLSIGVARCVIGTAALNTSWMAQAVERFSSDALIVGLDGRNGFMAVNGWIEQTNVSMLEVAKSLYEIGVRHALVTDVARDGTLSGTNVELARQVQEESHIRTIASGGVRDIEDIKRALEAGLAGVIAGKSLYDGTLDLRSALLLTKEADGC